MYNINFDCNTLYSNVINGGVVGKSYNSMILNSRYGKLIDYTRSIKYSITKDIIKSTGYEYKKATIGRCIGCCFKEASYCKCALIRISNRKNSWCCYNTDECNGIIYKSNGTDIEVLLKLVIDIEDIHS